MTLTELVMFLSFFALGVFSAGKLYKVGGIALAIVGFAAGFLFIPGLIIAYGKYREWAYCGDERMPPCKCGSSDFRVEVASEEPNFRFHEVCRACDRRYANRNRYEVDILEDGTQKPYMSLVKHQGWVEADREK